MTNRHRFHAIVWPLIGAGLIALIVTLYLLVRPYNDVVYGGGDSTVTPSTISRGGTITLSRESYCNNNRDVMVERWADRIAPDGRVTASLSLPPVQFFNAGQGLSCFAPAVSAIVIPDYIPAVNGEPTQYRLRFITTYKPNWVRTVEVVSFSEPFTITP